MIPQGMEESEVAAVQDLTLQQYSTPVGEPFSTPIGGLGNYGLLPVGRTIQRSTTPYGTTYTTPYGTSYSTPIGPGLSGMGQVVPPIKQETFKWVVLATAGLLIFSVGAYLLLRNKGKQQEPEEEIILE